MNRRLLIPLLALVFATNISCFCQVGSNSQDVFLGPKIGFSAHKAKFNFSEQEDLFGQEWQTGYQVGGAFSKPLKNIFHFHTEFYFAQKGKKTLIVENGLINQSKYYFLEAPILLRLQFEGGTVEAGTYKYHVDFGPTVSYWLGGKGSVGIEGFKNYKIVFDKDSTAVDREKEMVIYGANRLQWGLNLGFGIEYPVIKNQTVFIDLRLVLGNSNLVEFEGYSEFDLFGYDDDLNTRFTQIVLSVSYMFSYDWRDGLKGKSTINKRKQN